MLGSAGGSDDGGTACNSGDGTLGDALGEGAFAFALDFLGLAG